MHLYINVEIRVQNVGTICISHNCQGNFEKHDI